ncbi:MAG: DNA-processing protein DprA [Bryobacter sp.]|nr:DNA-processing protein DprA [Bryobacter sp.]
MRTIPEVDVQWLALRLVPGLGTRRAHLLIDHFGSVEALFRASVSELEACGLPGAVARSVTSGCTFEEAIDQQRRMAAAGVELLSFHDTRYPPRLREIYDPPLVLFCLGRLELLKETIVAVVGTRHPTAYGVAVAARLGADLAGRGAVVGSGMARGIDTAAQKAVVELGAPTVSVFGCGVDVIYPSENRRLADAIARTGLLLSEYPMASPPYPQNFPVRNRILSGISAGVLVVEGAQYSGSAITARLALEQNREVFAVPGNITSRQSFMPNLLIKQGAALIHTVEDILEALPSPDKLALRRKAAQQELFAPLATETKQEVFDPATPLKQNLHRVLSFDKPTHLDTLIEVLEDHSSSEIIAALFDLELAGRVKQLPGRHYLKTWVG